MNAKPKPVIKPNSIAPVKCPISVMFYVSLVPLLHCYIAHGSRSIPYDKACMNIPCPMSYQRNLHEYKLPGMPLPDRQ